MTNTNTTHHAATFGCLVIGYDRDAGSRRAASWALRELMPNGTLVIVHSCRPLHAPPSPLLSASERAALGHAVMDELMLDGDVAMFDVNVVSEVSDEDPVTALLDAARRYEASAIVVGAQQHSRLHRALGTVTSELQKTSPVPVIVVPAGSAAAGTPSSDAG
jgi:nucleotide-binding universal stress UspA family protein